MPSLSHGLPALGISHRRIVAAPTGEIVRLTGVNRSGLEYSRPGAAGYLAAAGMCEREADEIVCGWGANVVRVPLNQDWLLNGSEGRSSTGYLEDLDRLVSWYAERGAYTLFDLHWLDCSTTFGFNRDGSINQVPALPNLESCAALAVLAGRYLDEPAVLYEIFNEPHTPIADRWHPERNDTCVPFVLNHDGTLVPHGNSPLTMLQWKRWAIRLVRAIYEVHPRALIFVPGIDWAYDLRGMPLSDERQTEDGGSDSTVPAVVYSTHVYSHRRSRHGRVRGLGSVGWNRAFGELSAVVPVFVSEWGGGDSALAWGRDLLQYMDELDLGWTAWSWSDRPHLVRDAQSGDFTPTVFGELVRDALRNRGREATRDVSTSEPVVNRSSAG